MIPHRDQMIHKANGIEIIMYFIGYDSCRSVGMKYHVLLTFHINNVENLYHILIISFY